jgi:hypothetical protein
VLKPIEGCSWPGTTCETRIQKNLIESSSGDSFLGQIHKYSLKSLDNTPIRLREESNQCALGPEFQNLITNRAEAKTVADAFTEWAAQSRSMTKTQKLEFSKEVVKILEGDIQRRTWTLGSYVLYFSITLILLLQQFQQSSNLPNPPVLGNPTTLLITFLIPMVAAFYLQTLYSERLRGNMILHLIPILLLTTYAAYSVMISQGSISSGWRYAMMIALVVILAVAIYAFVYIRRVFNHCYRLQTGSENPPSSITNAITFGGIVVPTLLLTWMTYNF